MKKRRRKFFRRVLTIGAVCGVGYYLYRKSDKVKTVVDDSYESVKEKVYLVA